MSRCWTRVCAKPDRTSRGTYFKLDRWEAMQSNPRPTQHRRRSSCTLSCPSLVQLGTVCQQQLCTTRSSQLGWNARSSRTGSSTAGLPDCLLVFVFEAMKLGMCNPSWASAPVGGMFFCRGCGANHQPPFVKCRTVGLDDEQLFFPCGLVVGKSCGPPSEAFLDGKVAGRRARGRNAWPASCR